MSDYWNRQYGKEGALWGDDPSELARIAVDYLRKQRTSFVYLIDIGCGYGRDARYIAKLPNVKVLGIDCSKNAIEHAKNSSSGLDNVEFQCIDFRELRDETYDVIYLSNVYQILRNDERRDLRKTLKCLLKPGGLLFLSTHSVRDPEHYQRGALVEGEANSFIDQKADTYVHLCTKGELVEDFSFLDITELYEHDYIEKRVGGDHHHISWIMIALRPKE